uniref:Fidgetin-like protein 1 n=1 Tax=Saccoglossus kowalevskii TaxID=10224 RepID=A0ABM0MHQ8_SACKO|nr:PREDICTED: fidgetin-like protein 1-like [Saccoglossus kowalevskii]
MLKSETSTPSQNADAVRGMLTQLQYAQMTNRLSENDATCELYRQYFEKYSSIVDNQNKALGLNNYADTATALNRPSESLSWKSSVSLDNITSVPCIKSLIQNSKKNLDDPNSSTIVIAKPKQTRITTQVCSPVDMPTSHNAPRPLFKALTSTDNPAVIRSKPRNTSDSGFNYKASENSVRQSTSSNVSQDDPLRHSDFVPNQFAKGFGSREGKRGGLQSQMDDGWSGSCRQPSRPLQSFKRKASSSSSSGIGQGSFKSEDSMSRTGNYGNSYQGNTDTGEDSRNNQASSAFKTARDQLIINNQKKAGNRGVRGPPLTSSYGGTKKSLGTTRRGINSKFIPPVVSRDEDGDGGGTTYGRTDSRNHRSKKDESDEIVDERLKNIEPKMIELISNEIMDHGAPVAWDDIAGLQFAKSTIKEIVIWPMLRPDIFNGLRGPPKGLLLFGPPGTGKTLIGKCIASQSGATFFSISASSLTSKWVGEGEKMVRALFAVARVHQPAVIFIDEIDSLLTQRSDGEHESSRRIKTEFLVQLDGATTDTTDRILVVGATNRPQEIDEAARRRLVKRLYIPLPELQARKQIVENLLRQQCFSLNDSELQQICLQTEGYSGADMSNLCREAALGPIRCLQGSEIQNISADQVRPIIFQDFQDALLNVRPSVSEKDLDVYLEWNQQYGSGVK